MKTLKTILYATDFSESSVPACETALYLARLSGARVHVLHVLAELADQRRSRIPAEAFETFEKKLELQAIKDMEAFCKSAFDAEVGYDSEVIVGAPSEVILQRSGEIEADLIVMGTHGRAGLEHIVVGSTAEQVVRRSAVPVLTVRHIP